MTTIERVTLSVSIDTGNAGITDDPHGSVADLLESVAARIRDHRTSGVLHDTNGNSVGDYVLGQIMADDTEDDDR